jgi:hypothetical protein
VRESGVKSRGSEKQNRPQPTFADKTDGSAASPPMRLSTLSARSFVHNHLFLFSCRISIVYAPFAADGTESAAKAMSSNKIVRASIGFSYKNRVLFCHRIVIFVLEYQRSVGKAFTIRLQNGK